MHRCLSYVGLRMPQFSKKDLCIVETGNLVFVMCYPMFDSFLVHISA